MGDRRQARELALQALFFFDMDRYASTNKRLSEFCQNNEKHLTDGVKPFFMDLVNGVINHKDKIDKLLNNYSKNWKISRMPVVDRNIMRVAIYEFLDRSDIPCSVTINEAVEIGKKYSTKDSGSFINGVLDRIKTQEGFV